VELRLPEDLPAEGLGRLLKKLKWVKWNVRSTPGMYTASGLCQANARLVEKTETVYAELVEVIRGACAGYADETGWRPAKRRTTLTAAMVNSLLARQGVRSTWPSPWGAELPRPGLKPA
jgi:hypothetical protein